MARNSDIKDFNIIDLDTADSDASDLETANPDVPDAAAVLDDDWAGDITPESDWASDVAPVNIVPHDANDNDSSPEQIPLQKRHPFRNFMLVWSGLLLIVISVGLFRFYRFLENYEASYQASRPALDMDRYASLFQNKDFDAIYDLLTVKPVCTEFETTSDINTYLSELLADRSISYTPAEGYTEDSPKYLIKADDFVLAGLNLTRSSSESRKYGFPVWELSDFEIYTKAPESFLIQAPSNYDVSVNGIRLGADHLSESEITLDEERYVKEYASLPTCNRYYGEGLYLPPTVTATDDYGQEVPVTYDAGQQMYIVPFSSHAPDQEALEAYAIQAVKDYCEFISQDLGDNALDKYFPADSTALYMIKHNTSRQFFAHHRSSDFQNVEVKNFISYSSDVFYCEVYVEQVLVMSYGSPEPEVLPYTGRFYYVNLNGEWKISGIVY